jgi:YbbR domain-containing protein
MDIQEIKPNKSKFKVFTDRKSAVIFLACLLLSIAFWLLLSLSAESQETLVLKVKYNNLPEDKVLTEELPRDVKVLVVAEGFTLLGYKLGFAHNEIVVDLKNLNFQKKGDYYTSTWISSKNLDELNAQEGSKLNILSVYPDTIKIVMDKKVNKVLPVKFSGKSMRSPNYRIVGDVVVYPDSVHVTGGLHWLKKCDAIYTDSLDLLSNEGEVERKVNLQLLWGATAAEGKTVQVKMLVQSLKSRQMEVNIRSVNVPAGEELKLLPGTVQVTFFTTDSTFSTLNKSDFTAVADYNDLVFSQDKIEVQLTRFPKDIELPKISPAKVEYILRR